MTSPLNSSTQIQRRALLGKSDGNIEASETSEVSAYEGMLRAIIRALATGSSLQPLADTHDPIPYEPPSLSSIPVEVILYIISFIGDDSDGLYAKACLALTCSKLYHAYRLVHPDPIAWRVGPALIDAKGQAWDYALQHHIGVFLGPAYRRHRFDPRFLLPIMKWPAFLSREVYGNAYSQKEVELNDRYYDWGGVSSLVKPKLCTIITSLPSPFGLGDEWYALVFKALWKLHINVYTDARSKRVGLRGPPRHLAAYNLMMREYEEFYDGFVEWIVMMGI